MIAAATSLDLPLAVARLRADPGAVAWMARRELARAAADALANGESATDAVELLGCLADDAKWEVRLEVAQHLLLLPDEVFTRLADRLASDPTAFVRQAAERALDRRRRRARAAAVQQKDGERLARDFRKLEAEIGKPAMDRVLQFCQRQNEQFIGAVMHELRGILTFMKSSCQAVLAEAKPSRKTARLRDNLTLWENTVNDMDAFTRPAPLERRREHLRDVVTEAVEVARENVRKNGLDPGTVAVQVHVSEAIVLPMVRHLVLMALANVVRNAHEAFATGKGQLRDGMITIRSEVCTLETGSGAFCQNGPEGAAHKRLLTPFLGDAVRSAIADNGLGMSDEELAQVAAFRPGRQSKWKRYSTGYGLPIAVRNVVAHGGTLTIDSREDAGTTVTITLPLTHSDEENHHEHTSIDRRRRSTRRRGDRGHA